MPRKFLLLPCILLAVGLTAAPAHAHPMGNFSISHFAAIGIGPDEVRLRYRVDIAELPSVEEMRELSPEGTIADAAREAYLSKKSAALAAKLRLTLDGQPLALSVTSRDVRVRPGAADLPTLLVTVDCRAPLPADRLKHVLGYSDVNYPDRAGWKEVIATVNPGCRLIESSVPVNDLTGGGLETYPADLITVPPQVLGARIVYTATADTGASSAPLAALPSPPPPPAGRRTDTPRDRFTQLISSNDASISFICFALAVAFVLGCFHALAPGHGKTVVAAYLVGSRGTARHAFLLGAVVTLTHVAGVFALGFLVLFLSRYVVPEQTYPWLGFASGMMITLVGAQQFVQRYTRQSAVSSVEPSALDASHDPSRGGHTHDVPDRITPAALVAMGVSGGMVPCPSALIVLLGSIALHRVRFGLVLIVFFSLGLACVLIATGLLMLHARRAMERFPWPRKSKGGEPRTMPWPLRYLPLASSAAVALLGVGIAFQSLQTAGIVQIRW